jgi:hypothetical protein
MAETALFRSESGQQIHMDLPLPEHMQAQVTRGTLVRINSDGTPYTGEAADASEGAAVTERPAVSAPKAAWVGWAVHNGADADQAEVMTKHDLVETFGA